MGIDKKNKFKIKPILLKLMHSLFCSESETTIKNNSGFKREMYLLALYNIFFSLTIFFLI